MLAQVDELADSASTIYNVQLAVHEVCANIIEHAYGGQEGGRIVAALTITKAPCSIVIDLLDTGQAFTLERVQAPEPETLQEGGYGLFLVHTLLDEVAYIPATHQNCWRLVKRLT
jgi:serine/threonine-protein kinase RsbW